MAAAENRFAPELNGNDVIKVLKDLSNILGAFSIEQLLHPRLLDMRLLWPTRRVAPRWLSVISNARSWNNC